MPRVPRVSVGLPVYNGERYLARTLDDLLGQTFEDIEVVACDNASTDATPDILAEAARRDPRLRVVRNERNLGALPNANKAYSLARAPLYALAAYDDRHAPDFLERLVEALDHAPEAGLAYGRCTLIDSEGRPLRFDAERRVYLDASGTVFDYDAGLERDLPVDATGRYRAVLRSNDVNAPVHGLGRREVFDRIGPHRPHGSDRLVVAHAALLCPLAFVDAPLFGYRIHEASTYHLTRSEWMRRESGQNDAGSSLDGVNTLRAYLSVVHQTPLTLRQNVQAFRETIRYAIRPAVLRRLFRPNADHYFGWTGRGSAGKTNQPKPALPSTHLYDEWAWLQE